MPRNAALMGGTPLINYTQTPSCVDLHLITLKPNPVRSDFLELPNPVLDALLDVCVSVKHLRRVYEAWYRLQRVCYTRSRSPPERTPTFSPHCFNPQLQIQQLPPTSRAKIVAVFSLAWCRGTDWQLGQTMSLSWLLSQANLCLLGLWYQVTLQRRGSLTKDPSHVRLRFLTHANSLMITKRRSSAKNSRVIPYLLNLTLLYC